VPVSFVGGPPLATYTGALLANTSIPVWSEARRELPWLFGASVAAEGVAMQVMTRRLGFVGEVYRRGEAGRYARAAKACAATGAALLALRGKRSRAAAVAGGALVLGGELALRWSVFKAGFQSARDLRYTVVPQKRRLAEKAERR
jgi:hypothetical protein